MATLDLNDCESPPRPSRRELDEASDDSMNDNNDMGEDGEELKREGTISSARFNILCTMVGGGSLSVPMAFQQSGTFLLGPIILLASACITEFCFNMITDAARKLSPPPPHKVGSDTYESISSAAFGHRALLFSKTLVTLMCFFGSVGYAVLLRDMLQPITDFFLDHYFTDVTNTSGPTFANNLTMWIVILLITPVCTLQNLTSLKDLGAASMLSILILGSCIVYRSFQCNCPGIDSPYIDQQYHQLDWNNIVQFHLLPPNWKAVLDAFPLYVSVYVCHYNIPTVYNELQDPSPKRVRYWLKTTTWCATAFYMTVGFAGSLYTNCLPDDTKLQGNILLNFNEDDPLLLLGRMCLAITITLAFPLLTVPARDIILRTIFENDDPLDNNIDDDNNSLREPLLQQSREETPQELENDDENNQPTSSSSPSSHSFTLRLVFAILVLWSSVVVASLVATIDTVWDLLGSTLSILLSFLIPAGSYIVIMGRSSSRSEDSQWDRSDNIVSWKDQLPMYIAWAILFVYIPLMIISTINAVYDTFFK